MHNLPIDLQLLTIDYLDPYDIVRLQQTCRNLFTAVEESAQTVWKACLWRQCLRNGVFWPTYKDLSTAREFKKAATSPARYVRAYDEALASAGQGISSHQFRAKLPGIKPENLYTHLVPGGRYMLVSEETRLSMWDLASLNPANEATQVLAHGTKQTEDLCAVQIFDALSIRVLIRVSETEWASSYAPPLEYQVLEISAESNGHFIVSRSKSLKVIPAWKLSHGLLPILYRGLVALPVMENAVVVWDHERNEYTLSGVTFWDARAFGLFMNETHLFYTIKSGIQAVEIPPLIPVPRDPILVSHKSARGSFPENSFFCPNGYIAPATRDFVGPEIFDPGYASDTSNDVYTFGFMEDTDEMARRFRRYNFTFNPEHPPDSTLCLVDISQDHTRCGYHVPLLDAVRHRACDGRLATLWIDDTAEADPPTFLTSAGEPFQNGHGDGPPIDPSRPNSNIQPVHIQWSLNPVDTPSNPELADIQFCPISGKMTILRTSPDDNLLVEIWTWI